MNVTQRRMVAEKLSRGWRVAAHGPVTGDVYLLGLGKRLIAITKDGRVERVS